MVSKIISIEGVTDENYIQNNKINIIIPNAKIKIFFDKEVIKKELLRLIQPYSIRKVENVFSELKIEMEDDKQ